MEQCIRLFVFALTLVCTLAERKSYEGYKLFRTVQRPTDFDDNYKHWHTRDTVDFWGIRDDSMDILVKPETVDEFEAFLKTSRIEYEVDNLENIFQIERNEETFDRLRSANKESDKWSLSHFYNGSEVDSYIDYLQQTYPQLVETEVIGKSREGRAIRCVKISSADRKVTGERPIVFIDAGTHAREWASHMTVLHLMKSLVEKSEENQELLHKVDWVIVPIVNPDGYHYTHQTDRLWRKNRAVNKGSSCRGVDLNRNFGYKWEADNNYCSEVYSGTAPFSEPETAAMRDILNRYRENIKLYLAFHSYGNYVIYPWGYDKIKIKNWRDQVKLGDIFADAVRKSSGQKYMVGNAAILLYPAAGASDDYAASLGVEYVYTIEMSRGTYGFVLPAKEIPRVGKEVVDGVKAMVQSFK